MRRFPSRSVTTLSAVVLTAASLVMNGPTVLAQAGGSTPASPWGPDDQKGALNRVSPEHVQKAAGLIREGKVYDLGRVYEPGIPFFGQRHMKLTLPGNPTGGPMGAHNLVYNDEMFSGEIGQIGTQIDGLGHIGVREGGDDVYYNRNKSSDIRTPYGFTKLGIENFRHLVTRGVLIDVAGHKGVDRLKPDYIISVADIEGALEKQGSEIREADVVLIRTGHGQLWMKDNDTYNSGQPGPGITAIKWLIEKKIVMIGADNWGVEAVPGESAERPFEGHQWLLQRNGIYIVENLDLEALAADKAWDFAFVLAPVPFKGATGSPGNPIAIR